MLQRYYFHAFRKDSGERKSDVLLVKENEKKYLKNTWYNDAFKCRDHSAVGTVKDAREVTWVNFRWVCLRDLSKPVPLPSLFYDQL